MKKGIFLVLIAVLLLTGCGKSDTLTCTAKDESSKSSVEVVATFENDKVTKVGATMTFDDEDTAKQFCAIMSLMETYAPEETAKIGMKCDGKKVTIKDFAAYESSEDEDEKIIGMSKDDFKKAMEDEGATCK